MDWWDRVEQLLRARRMTGAGLARATGISPKLVYKHLEGAVKNPRGAVLKKYADALETSEQFLRYGVPPSTFVELKRIPLLTLKDIGGLKRGDDPHSAWDGVSVVAVPKSVSDEAFGVTLEGDESIGGEFNAGSVVICEPHAPKAAGKYVVAVVDHLRRGVFGKFKPKRIGREDEFTLEPVNPDAPPVEIGKHEPGFIVGRAIKHIRDI